MEKEQLLFLTRNYDSLTAEEAQELISTKSVYPYCQLFHNLAARGAKDNQLAGSEYELQLSAVYATDRSILKSIISSPRKQRLEVADKSLGRATPETKNDVLIPLSKDLSGDDLLAEISQDLERLRTLKHEFELSFEHTESDKPQNKIDERKVNTPLEIVEPNSEELIKEIKNTKKKIKPEGAKQKEQFEIIDQFIKTQPTISNAKTKTPLAPSTNDLTENTQSFNDHIISETLVNVLLKQGKKDKAMEVLKKLIWKFPQKKAYFAAQIEELKK